MPSSFNRMASMTSDYNELSLSQSTIWRHAKPLFVKAMSTSSLPSSKLLCRVADLGCATGGNSIAPLVYVSSQLPSVCVMEAILVDLPSNPWTVVASTVTPESITASQPHRRASTTFVSMIGRTFYEPCVPPETLTLSYSFVATHWLQSYGGDLPSGLCASDPLHVPEPEVWNAWKSAGESDWNMFVNARYKELDVGGVFIGAVCGIKSDGDHPWSKVGYLVYQAMESRVKRGDGLDSCVLPCWYRTDADIRAGFEQTTKLDNYGDDNGRVWDVEVCEYHETVDPIRERLLRGEITAREYGRLVIDSFRAVSNPTIVNCLSKTMDPDELDTLMEDVYEACIDPIGADPDQYNLDESFWYVLAKKIK
mmetsp:Transcript_37319/g.43438  ORF Transcript_37319/g.43438 Transcript_37319/m.43438 type:complete len:366 (-) Transcript_37319:456-1553(-)